MNAPTPTLGDPDSGFRAKVMHGLSDPGLAKYFRRRVLKGEGDECWAWDGMVKPCGYGRCQLRGRVTVGAPRVSYFLHHGVWPGELEVCHRCDNPNCVNPGHLFLGTHAENMADMAAKGRANRPIGERAPRSKLTAEQVLDIRRRFVPGRKGNRAALAKEFGVSTASLWALLRRRTWRHV